MTLSGDISHATLDAYRTCEFATLGRDGTPLTWPVSPWRQADGTLLVTASIGFPQKALNVRRDGRVGLLFSEPTGSGLDDPPQIFIHGTAVCSAELTTSPEGLEDYWSMLYKRQPSSRAYTLPGLRSLMDWYYMRLLITVTPAHAEERPSSTAVALPPDGLTAGSPELAQAWSRAEQAGIPGARQLARYPTAVLGALDTQGAVALVRTTPQPAGDRFAVAAAPGADLAAGPASLLAHRHDEKLSGMHYVLVCGQVARPPAPAGAGDWLFTPERVVEPAGSGGPGSAVRSLRSARTSAARYLGKRGLERPAVPWRQYRALARRAG
jgi:hypothetical protein